MTCRKHQSWIYAGYLLFKVWELSRNLSAVFTSWTKLNERITNWCTNSAILQPSVELTSISRTTEDTQNLHVKLQCTAETSGTLSSNLQLPFNFKEIKATARISTIPMSKSLKPVVQNEFGKFKSNAFYCDPSKRNASISSNQQRSVIKFCILMILPKLSFWVLSCLSCFASHVY